MNRTDTDAINTLAERLKTLLDTRRDFFVIDEATFGALSFGVHLGTESAASSSRTVSAASLKLVYDWCTNDWPMDLEEFLSGMFLGREWDKLTPTYQLIPEAKDRLTADTLGFGHLLPAEGDAAMIQIDDVRTWQEAWLDTPTFGKRPASHTRTEAQHVLGNAVMTRKKDAAGRWPEHLGVLVSINVEKDLVIVRSHDTEPGVVWRMTRAEYAALWEVD